ncbi:hypothetical protein BHL21_14520 [Bacillus cereus]|nr:hypothetical protein BHL21_14520 [Bacillus cereus]
MFEVVFVFLKHVEFKDDKETRLTVTFGFFSSKFDYKDDYGALLEGEVYYYNIILYYLLD